MNFKKGLIVAFLCAIAGNHSDDTLELAYDLVDHGFIPTDDKELKEYFPQFDEWWRKKKDITYKVNLSEDYWKKRDLTEEEVECHFTGEPYGDEYEDLSNLIDVKYSKHDELDFITSEYGNDCLLLAAWALAGSNCDLYEFFSDLYRKEWREFLSELPGVSDEARASYWEGEAERLYWEREAAKGNSEL